MDTPPADAFRDELRDSIVNSVHAGFFTPDEIVEDAVEMFADEMDEEQVRPIAKQLTAEAWDMHEKAQRKWPSTTDCDRLDAAFRDLEAVGIVCRQNFSCCGNCGSAEIGEEMENHLPPARGYAFYHMQDTERAVEGGGIYLNYGAVEEGEGAALTVGTEVATTIAHYGLKVDWNGSLEKRIGVSLDWKKRRAL